MNCSVQIIIVLFQCSLDESLAYKSIQPQLESFSFDYELILFNNDSEITIKDDRYLVINSEENLKIAGAYNYALDRAVKSNRDWLLLLDQDTEVPNGYFKELQFFFSKDYKPDLAAIVPVLKSENTILSPKKVSACLRLESDVKEFGYNKRVTAINSMSLVNVNFIHSLGGFKNDYQLDMLDRWIYYQMMKNDKTVFVLELYANHNLSFSDIESNVSPERYADYLSVENKFALNELSVFNILLYKFKLLVRSVLQLLKFKNREYSKASFATIFKL